MKFTLSWLKDYLEIDADLDTIVATLNATGLEVEGVENPADSLGAFKIGHVTEAVKHPDADKLKVCTVNTGAETVTIVCGAPNARADMKVVLGRPGDYVPGLDVTLALRPVRGVESNGMMCSSAELNLGEDSDGIMDLPADAPIGESYIDWAGLNDPVIEVAITPNRQDCLGIYGIARDLAAAGLGTLKPLTVPTISPAGKCPQAVELPSDTCSRFIGRAITGVTNRPSPEWMQNRLKAIGLRPISALVDITNYISYAVGRPLHVYDMDKLSGTLQARDALAGEGFVALDDNEYTSQGGECVIADDADVQGFGGIIGGLKSGCSDTTKNVFLECALFDPISIATTGRQHGIITDARYRFERGVDPLFVEDGADIAAQMILDLCGGVASEKVDVGEAVVWDKTVTFRPERVKSLGGLDLAAADSLNILANLGFTVGEASERGYSVQVPSWRGDVDGEADLVEDVLRIHGLDNVPSVPLPAINHRAGSTLSALQKRSRAAKRALAASGMMECVTWSFMDRRHAELFGGGGDDIIIDNPISSELDCMRPTTLANLLVAAQRNANRGAEGVSLFEVGPTYDNDTTKGQNLVAGGVRTGKTSPKHWAKTQSEVSVFDARADAVTALKAAGAPIDNLQIMDGAGDHYHPGRSGTLRLGPKNILATFGEIHPAVLKALDVTGPAVGFEVNLDKIPAGRKSATSKGALSATNLQSVNRDFAFVVDTSVKAGDLIRAVKGADKAAIQEVILFDVYIGAGLPADKKSMAISVRLQPKDTTFSDKDIEAIASKIVTAASKATGAHLRT